MTPFESEAELETWIKRTEVEIRRKQRKDLGEEAEPEEDPTFPLVDRPDEELNEEEQKEKKRQRLMKAGWEARNKLREEKRREKERLVRASLCKSLANEVYRRRNSGKRRRSVWMIHQDGQLGYVQSKRYCLPLQIEAEADICYP